MEAILRELGFKESEHCPGDWILEKNGIVIRVSYGSGFVVYYFATFPDFSDSYGQSIRINDTVEIRDKLEKAEANAMYMLASD